MRPATPAHTVIPIPDGLTTRASRVLILNIDPFIDAIGFDKFQIFDDSGMMGDAIDNMNVAKRLKPAAWEILAFKTPGHAMLPGAISKPVPAA